MRHHTSQKMFRLWDELRGTNPAPMRSDLEAASFADLIPSIFMIKMLTDIATIQMAGGDICALFGDKLRGKAFATFWLNGVDRKPSTLARQCAHEQELFLIDADGLTHQGRVTQLELILLPLLSEQQQDASIIGTISRIGPQLGPNPVSDTPHIIGMSLTQVRTIERGTLVGTFGTRQARKGQSFNGALEQSSKQIKHLSVFDGGRDWPEL